MRYILRNKSIITGKKNLEYLYTFKNFPVFTGCVDDLDEKKDIKANMSFSICRDSGIIQLNKVLPLGMVYMSGHADATNPLWQEDYGAFAKFLGEFPIKNVLEIGGGNGILAKLCTEDKENIAWTIIEPNPLFKGNKKIKVIKGWFDEKLKIKTTIDTIIYSHVLEHIYDPPSSIKQISNLLKKGDEHIFSVPNLYVWLSKKYTNCLNFEHTIFLTEYFIDYLLKKYGFKIIKKKYFMDHSIFYATEKGEINLDASYVSKYKEYKAMFNDFINYHKDLIKKLNHKIRNIDSDIYLFGAHFFSLYLLGFGLKRDKIKAVLDNSPLKQNKRLYGTDFQVYPPEIIKNKKSVAVILKAASYQKEIKEQLLNLNRNVTILE